MAAKEFGINLTVLSFSLQLFISALGGLVDTQGKEFVVGFMMNGPDAETAELELQISSWVHENVTVNLSTPADLHMMTNITVVIPPGEVALINLPAELRLEEGTSVANKAVLVTSDYEVTIFAFNKGDYSHDSFLALPTDALGDTYLAVTMVDELQHCPVQVGVASGSAHTILNIVLPHNPALHVIYDGKVYNETQSFQVPLLPHQMFQMQNWNDLTGLLIQADNPVAVYSGATCAAMSGHSKDLTLAQLPPIEYWGMHFVIIPSPSATYGEVIKVIARGPGTIIGVEIPHLQEVRTILLQRGGQASELQVLRQADVMVLKSNKPVLVMYFTRSFVPKDTKGDTSMTLIPAVEQYIPFSQYKGVKTASRRRQLDHVGIIVCRSGHRQDIAISSSKVEHTPATEWQEIGQSGFSYAILRLERHQSYTFQSAIPSEEAANFGLWFLGYMPYEGYGHPAGLIFHTPEPEVMAGTTIGPNALFRGLNEDGRNFMEGVGTSTPVFTAEDATIPPKVEKIVAIVAAVSVVSIVVIFKVVGCFYTLRESKV